MPRVSRFVSAGQLTSALVIIAAVTAVIWPRARTDVATVAAAGQSMVPAPAAPAPTDVGSVTPATAIVENRGAAAALLPSTPAASEPTADAGAPAVELSRPLRAEIRIVPREPGLTPQPVLPQARPIETLDPPLPPVADAITTAPVTTGPREPQIEKPAVTAPVRPKSPERTARKTSQQAQTNADCVPFLWPGDQPNRWKPVCGSSNRKGPKS